MCFRDVIFEKLWGSRKVLGIVESKNILEIFERNYPQVFRWMICIHLNKNAIVNWNNSWVTKKQSWQTYFILLRKVNIIDLDYLIFSKAFSCSPLVFYWLWAPFLVVWIYGRAPHKRLAIPFVSHQVFVECHRASPLTPFHCFIRLLKGMLFSFSDNTELEKIIIMKNYRINI